METKQLTREEAIKQLKWYFECDDGTASDSITKEAYELAIKALEQPEIVITPEEFKELMALIAEMDDEESRHYRMDCCMVELLNQFGYEEGTKIFENTKKWYA